MPKMMVRKNQLDATSSSNPQRTNCGLTLPAFQGPPKKRTPSYSRALLCPKRTMCQNSLENEGICRSIAHISCGLGACITTLFIDGCFNMGVSVLRCWLNVGEKVMLVLTVVGSSRCMTATGINGMVY